MNVKIEWSKRARLDMKSLYAYIFKENPHGADKAHNKITASVGLLSEMPQMGHEGERIGTLELTIKISAGTTYTVIYRLMGDLVDVLRVMHGARTIPDFIDDDDPYNFLM